LTCKATLNGRNLAGQGIGGCMFAIPHKSKGKKLVIAVSGKGATGAVYRSSFRYTIH
jgi:hypothetical protein